mmetsp:Transcript_28960/g.45402  ORF Transcript_28960/g.45402 Transcript_28960/m.45402 type:complete len:199 (+) Transcript_28960:362-958(+)
MATRAVRVRHLGKETRVEALVLDDTPNGGAEVFRQLGKELGLDPARLKIVHKGKLLSPTDVCSELREVAVPVIQVIGGDQTLPSQPITVRFQNVFSRVQDVVLGGWGLVVQSCSSGFGARIVNLLIGMWAVVWEFLRTFMPGHVPAPRPGGLGLGGRQQEEDRQESGVRFERRIETDARRCRDEINRETVDRMRRGDQ